MHLTAKYLFFIDMVDALQQLLHSAVWAGNESTDQPKVNASVIV